jgi:hypothetical protein
MKKYARKCNYCNNGMEQGYLDAGNYFCSIDHLIAENKKTNPNYNLKSWDKDVKDHPDNCYYSEWEEIDEDEFFNKDGVLFTTEFEWELYHRLNETNYWLDKFLTRISEENLLSKNDSDYLELAIQLAPNETLLKEIENNEN